MASSLSALAHIFKTFHCHNHRYKLILISETVTIAGVHLMVVINICRSYCNLNILLNANGIDILNLNKITA